jgi:hypothetical protein
MSMLMSTPQYGIASQVIVCEGTLKKRNRVLGWKSRFFSVQGPYFCYYRCQPSVGDPSDWFIEIAKIGDVLYTGRRFIFEVECPGRTLTLSAETKQDALRWMRILQLHSVMRRVRMGIVDNSRTVDAGGVLDSGRALAATDAASGVASSAAPETRTLPSHTTSPLEPRWAAVVDSRLPTLREAPRAASSGTGSTGSRLDTQGVGIRSDSIRSNSGGENDALPDPPAAVAAPVSGVGTGESVVSAAFQTSRRLATARARMPTVPTVSSLTGSATRGEDTLANGLHVAVTTSSPSVQPAFSSAAPPEPCDEGSGAEGRRTPPVAVRPEPTAIAPVVGLRLDRLADVQRSLRDTAFGVETHANDGHPSLAWVATDGDGVRTLPPEEGALTPSAAAAAVQEMAERRSARSMCSTAIGDGAISVRVFGDGRLGSARSLRGSGHRGSARSHRVSSQRGSSDGRSGSSYSRHSSSQRRSTGLEDDASVAALTSRQPLRSLISDSFDGFDDDAAEASSVMVVQRLHASSGLLRTSRAQPSSSSHTLQSSSGVIPATRSKSVLRTVASINEASGTPAQAAGYA